MIELVKDLPDHVAAFRATGSITGLDYDRVINPRVSEIYKKYGKINYFLELDTELTEYSSCAWFKDAVLGFVYLTEWGRIAVVSRQDRVKKFTNFFGTVLPIRFRGFMMHDLDEAREWVSVKI